MSIKIYQVDSFTDEPFSGNPAAICPLTKFPSDYWLQQVATEINLSETAFVVPGGGRFDLRWFTPKAEVDLCGHATLAAAHILWETNAQDVLTPIEFETRSGRLTCEQVEGDIQMDFPVTQVTEVKPPEGLIESLGVDPLFVGQSKFDFLVQVADEAAVRGASVDFGKLGKIKSRGAMITAQADSPEFDFVSRYFAPSFGIDEDPVTGSAHCALAPFWKSKLGKDHFVAFQASRRGGKLRVELKGDRAKLTGSAITVMRGELLV